MPGSEMRAPRQGPAWQAVAGVEYTAMLFAVRAAAKKVTANVVRSRASRRRGRLGGGRITPRAMSGKEMAEGVAGRRLAPRVPDAREGRGGRRGLPLLAGRVGRAAVSLPGDVVHLEQLQVTGVGMHSPLTPLSYDQAETE